MAKVVNFANFLSLLRILITPIIVWILLFHQSYYAGAEFLFILAGISDTCDGYLARRYDFTTELGSFLDPLADKVLVFGIFSAFYFLHFIPLWFVIIIVMRDVVITLLRVYGVQQKQYVKTSYLGKLKTSLQFILIFALFGKLGLQVDGNRAFLTDSFWDYFFGNSLFWNFVNRYIALDLVVVVLASLVLTFTLYSGVDYCVKTMWRRS